MLDLKFCIIIPIYNHAIFLDKVICDLIDLNLPIILVDDGSNCEEKDIIAKCVEKYQDKVDIDLITLYLNQGKGAALLQGFKKAFNRGFSHALQVDADGQHDFNDIKKLMDLSKKYPQDLISGLPVYDDSIPKARLYGRYITHFWVYIETLSFSIKDSMCGFRCYPLKATCDLISHKDICRRMDFDTDIMVRLYFKGTKSRFLKTHVIYPQNGISNFKALDDNIRISIMHTKLVIYMLTHFVSILALKFKPCATSDTNLNSK